MRRSGRMAPRSTGRRCATLAAVVLAAAAQALAAAAEEAPEAPQSCVFVLHGLARRASSMDDLCGALAHAGFHAENVAYPSTEGTFDEMVSALATAVAERSQTCGEIHFVGYSLGALVVRGYLARSTPPHLGRVVLLAPPNHGSEIVDEIGWSWTFRALMGRTASRLGTGADSLARSLPPPSFPVGVIAGDRWINVLGWLFIPGVHDGTVSVASARLDGMTDFLLVHRTHTFLMDAPEVAAATIAFLRSGRFEEGACDR